MEHFTTISGTRSYLDRRRAKGISIGFVPTMGALHHGHLALIQRSKQTNDLTICSIFVNPTQFNNPDDLKHYPRTLSRDIKMLEEAGCDVLFAPEAGEIYPKGLNETIDLDLGRLERVMEGKFRPGHFQGVALIVKKLFDIVNPTRAYFGKKDYQQLAVISHMVSSFSLPIELVPCETIRESDGLAMSSRNMRLTIAEREIAPAIYKVLAHVKANTGHLTVQELRARALKMLEETAAFKVEYLEIADGTTLLPLSDWRESSKPMAFIAVHLGDVRLIDNIELFS